MLIYRSPTTGAWMMTRDGSTYFEWIDGTWEPHRADDRSRAADSAGAER